MPLTLSIRVHSKYANITTDFIVVDCPSSYNVILGCLAIGDLKLSINMKTLLIKFPTPKGVGSVRGNQKSTQTCYSSSVIIKTRVTYETHCVEPFEAVSPQHLEVIDPDRISVL